MARDASRPIYDLLYIEDRAYDLEVVRAVLKDRNHRIRFNSLPSNAEVRQYVERTGRYADAPLPDLIIVDVHESDPGGVECIREMRQHRIWKLIPIIALVRDEPHIAACYDLHVNACIEKPDGLDALAGVIVAIHDFWFRHVALLPSEATLLGLLRP